MSGQSEPYKDIDKTLWGSQPSKADLTSNPIETMLLNTMIIRAYKGGAGQTRKRSFPRLMKPCSFSIVGLAP